MAGFKVITEEGSAASSREYTDFPPQDCSGGNQNCSSAEMQFESSAQVTVSEFFDPATVRLDVVRIAKELNVSQRRLRLPLDAKLQESANVQARRTCNPDCGG